MKKQFLVVATAALMAMLTVVPAFAQGQVVVTGGTLSVAPTAIGFGSVALAGVAQSTNGTTSAWSVVDSTGSGAGWNLTIAATNFVNAATKTIAVGGFTVALLDTAIVPVDGNTKPVSTANTTPLVLGSAQKLVSAAVDTGMGSYTVQPTFTLAVPAATYAGTYTSTVTLQMVSAP